MKNLFYKLYALFFNLSRIFPIKQSRVALVAPHNGGNGDSLGLLKDYLEKKGGYEIIFISTQDLKLDFSSVSALIKSCLKAAGFFTLKAKALATSKFIFLNDNFMPMASLRFSDEAVITQLWHAEGAFKRFGLSAPLPEEVRKREKKCSENLDYVVCTSKNVAPIYAEAFGVDESKILPIGSPRTDKLFNRDISSIRTEFDKKHPECKAKKLILYAPTFRDSAEKDAALLSSIDMVKFNEALPDYSLLIKLHPQIHSSKPINGATDVTSEDIGALTLICDSVITDYSSVCMDFALLSKPCFFYAFDLDEYEDERSFYFDYESYVPGPVAKDFDTLLENIKNPRNGEEKLRSFREFNFDFVDCNNTARVFENIISANS